MGKKGLKVLSSKLFILSLVMQGLIPCTLSFNQLGMQGINPLIKPVYAQSQTNTTIYLPGIEKNLITKEVNKYYTVGSVTLQRNTKDGVEKLYYLFPDHLSSTRLIINNSKTESSYLSYYPYGITKSSRLIPSSITNLYTNQKQDSEVGLYYYHARYYDPTTGHFLSADYASGPNRYSYVGNNPIIRNDPGGNFYWEEEGMTNYAKPYNPDDYLATALALKFDKQVQYLIEGNKEVLKNNKALYFVIVRPDDPQTKNLYNFMIQHGFSGMTHEDVPETRQYSCYPMCQFYTEEAAQKAAYNTNYATRFADALMPHEFQHNLQSVTNETLAETFHPGKWESPYHGFMEAAADEQYNAGGAYYQTQVVSLGKITDVINAAMFIRNPNPANDEEEVRDMKYNSRKQKDLKRNFANAKLGDMQAFNKIRNYLGESSFDQMFW